MRNVADVEVESLETCRQAEKFRGKKADEGSEWMGIQAESIPDREKKLYLASNPAKGLWKTVEDGRQNDNSSCLCA